MKHLIGEKVVLRPLSDAYIYAYLSAFTQEVRTLLHVTDTDTEYAYLCDRIKEKRTFFYCIFDKDAQKVIGAIEIRGSEHPGQLYTWLHQDYWGKGYFQEAVSLAAMAYFSSTHTFFFTARVDSSNKRSYKALKKAGFVDYAIIHRTSYVEQYELLLINHSSKLY